MVAVEVTKNEQQVLDAMRASTKLRGAIVALVAVARDGELAGKSERALANASAELPKTKTAATISIEQMKAELRAQMTAKLRAQMKEELRAELRAEQMRAELRAADCLYDDTACWRQLGAKKVPRIPDTVIQEAYEKGGRVILRCSSISEKTEALRTDGHLVFFGGDAKQSHYRKSVVKPEWIVVPSHIDELTLNMSKEEVVSPETPAPTPEDWFSVIAYARLDGGRQPNGCEFVHAFTTKRDTLVGSFDDGIYVTKDELCETGCYTNVGAARFGRTPE